MADGPTRARRSVPTRRSRRRNGAPFFAGMESRIMRLDTSQQMRTEMRLRMAPRMIQSMEILQLPIMALQERIDQELSENPILVDLRESSSSETDDSDS